MTYPHTDGWLIPTQRPPAFGRLGVGTDEVQQSQACRDMCTQASCRVYTNLNHMVAHVHSLLPFSTAGGLTLNDFIVAAKVNQLKLTDMLEKKKARFWA